MALPFILRARGRSYAERGRVECGLRVIEGRQSGLGRRWRHGVGTPAPGSLYFQGTVGGLRFLRRRPMTLEVWQIDRSTRRVTGAREAWSLWPGTDVVQMVTPSARLEWGVSTGQLPWAIDRPQPLTADDDAR